MIEGVFKGVFAAEAVGSACRQFHLQIHPLHRTGRNLSFRLEPEEADRLLQEIRENNRYDDLDLSPFWNTYDNWKDSIFAYFHERKTSGVVEGINNKARVITKRSYGLKCAESLWTRLLLDVNHAADTVLRTVQQTRELARGIQAKFADACT